MAPSFCHKFEILINIRPNGPLEKLLISENKLVFAKKKQAKGKYISTFKKKFNRRKEKINGKNTIFFFFKKKRRQKIKKFLEFFCFLF